MKWVSLSAIALIAIGIGIVFKSIGVALIIFGVGLGMWVHGICYFKDLDDWQ